MVRQAIDFSLVDRIMHAGSVVDPIEEVMPTFEPATAAEMDRMVTLVRDVDGRRVSDHNTLMVTYAYNSHPEDYVVRQQAMIRTLGLFGVKDAYYEPARHPGIATERTHRYGWGLSLLRPDGFGEFKVVFTRTFKDDTAQRVMNRQSVFYRRR